MATRTPPSWLGYHPSGRKLDVEVFPFDNLRQRGTPAQIAAAYRYGFHMLVCVTEGTVTQLIDFEPVMCRPGSFLTIRPGQVHSFGSADGWEGWLVFFRAEFLLPSIDTMSTLLPAIRLDRMSDHIVLPASDFEAVTECITRMSHDAASGAPPEHLHALFRHQLFTLLLRLTILYEQFENAFAGASRSLRRFLQFRHVLEQKFAVWHRAADYAAALACTEKSIARAALEATGKSAKELIAARIALEAKRRLAHTDLAIHLIAESLGFDEATNFAKFFRRETGYSPLEFRRRAQLVERQL